MPRSIAYISFGRTKYLREVDMTRALIIGGGVAGPVTAMALQRAGIDAVVYEAYPPSTEDVGS
jgi:NADPH-dependent 2,4-dienoyl-CoA reductase/sulfur reductase-like enzyme